MANKLNIAITGATGFVGLEIIKKIYSHPFVNIKYLFVKDSMMKIFIKIYQKIYSITQVKKIDINLINQCDVLFLVYHIQSYKK